MSIGARVLVLGVACLLVAGCELVLGLEDTQPSWSNRPDGGGGSAGDAAGAGGWGGSGAKGGHGGDAGSGGTVGGCAVGGGELHPADAPSCTQNLDCRGHSCCESRRIPPGEFQMGRSQNPNDADFYAEGFPDELPEHPAAIAACYLDAFEVTVGRFRQFASHYVKPAANAGANPAVPGSGWNEAWNDGLPGDSAQLVESVQCGGVGAYTWTDSPGNNEDKPINCVSWWVGFAFCAWDGGRLATEAEWEDAAAGGCENRLYPWGMAEPDDTLLVWNCAPQQQAPHACADVSDLDGVGSRMDGISRWGHLDLAGSLWEWVLDWRGDYGSSPCDSCAVLDDPGMGTRVIRGGARNDYLPTYARAAVRNGAEPGARLPNVGVRCARN